LISTDLQLPLFGNAAEKITANPEPLLEIGQRELDRLS
jgi:hypothetical protein